MALARRARRGLGALAERPLRSRAGAALWLVLVPVLDAYDYLYARYWGSEPIGPVLSFDRRVYRGPERRFPDGTVLHPADPVGELHLQNRRVLAIHARATHPVAAGLTFRRLLVASLRALAGRAAEDPGLGNLRVFHSLTILVTGAERIGFMVGDGSVPARGRALFFHLLLCRYHAAGFARLPPTFLPARELWMTAAELQRRYGAEASPVMRPGTPPASGRLAHR